jgi:hypothetical protein
LSSEKSYLPTNRKRQHPEIHGTTAFKSTYLLYLRFLCIHQIFALLPPQMSGRTRRRNKDAQREVNSYTFFPLFYGLRPGGKHPTNPCELANSVCSLNDCTCIQYDSILCRFFVKILKDQTYQKLLFCNLEGWARERKIPRKTATCRRPLTVCACDGNPNSRSAPAPGTAPAFHESSPGSDPRAIACPDRWPRIGGRRLGQDDRQVVHTIGVRDSKVKSVQS